MNKCRYISEYHQNIILQHCNSIHFKYTPQTTILFRELPRSPEHLGRPVAVRGWAASWPHNVHFMSLEPWSHAGAGDNFHWLLTEWAATAPQLHTGTGCTALAPQTSSPPGHRWVLSLTGDAATIRDLTDPGQSTKKVQSAWMKVIREEAQIRVYKNTAFLIMVAVVNYKSCQL